MVVMPRNVIARSFLQISVLLWLDTAHGLFGHAVSLVSHRLMMSWKMDLKIALAAIEVKDPFKYNSNQITVSE